MKKISLLFLLQLTCNINLFAQYNEGNMMSSFNQYYTLKPNQNFITSAKITEFNNIVMINWKVSNDTTDGYYVVYKSHNFEKIELVDLIKIVPEVNPNIPYICSIEDTMPSDFYNFYHVVRFLKNQNINFDYTKIEEVSLANLSYRKSILDRKFEYYYSQTK